MKAPNAPLTDANGQPMDLREFNLTLNERMSDLKRQAAAATARLKDLRKRVQPEIERDQLIFDTYAAGLNLQILENFATIIRQQNKAFAYEQSFFDRNYDSDDPSIQNALLVLCNRQSERVLKIGKMLADLAHRGIIKSQTNIQVNNVSTSLNPAREQKLRQIMGMLNDIGLNSTADGAPIDVPVIESEDD